MASIVLAKRRPILACLHQTSGKEPQSLATQILRTFTTSTPTSDDVASATAEPKSKAKRKAKTTMKQPIALYLDPTKVYRRREERLTQKYQNVQLVGSRRRRALASIHPDSLPFEQMPYQCFQEARKVLAADREEKLVMIEEMRKRVARATETSAESMGGEHVKKGKLVRMEKYLEELKVLADINDPMIKKRFEDGIGDMNRPVYRHLAKRRWADYNEKIQIQRITQFYLVPDLLPHMKPTADISLGFGRRNIAPGAFVETTMSEKPARLRVQVFDKGKRLVSIAVVDADVPDEVKDSFTTRCHFLAVNIPLAPDASSIPFVDQKSLNRVALDWLPPFAQKGSPYHRMSIFVLQQPEGKVIDVEDLKSQKKLGGREGWNLQSFVAWSQATPIAATLFRTIWDEGADEIGKKFGYKNVGIELIRKKSEKNIYKKKDGARFR